MFPWESYHARPPHTNKSAQKQNVPKIAIGPSIQYIRWNGAATCGCTRHRAKKVVRGTVYLKPRPVRAAIVYGLRWGGGLSRPACYHGCPGSNFDGQPTKTAYTDAATTTPGKRVQSKHTRGSPPHAPSNKTIKKKNTP